MGFVKWKEYLKALTCSISVRRAEAGRPPCASDDCWEAAGHPTTERQTPDGLWGLGARLPKYPAKWPTLINVPGGPGHIQRRMNVRRSNSSALRSKVEIKNCFTAIHSS